MLSLKQCSAAAVQEGLDARICTALSGRNLQHVLRRPAAAESSVLVLPGSSEPARPSSLLGRGGRPLRMPDAVPDAVPPRITHAVPPRITHAGLRQTKQDISERVQRLCLGPPPEHAGGQGLLVDAPTRDGPLVGEALDMGQDAVEWVANGCQLEVAARGDEGAGAKTLLKGRGPGVQQVLALQHGAGASRDENAMAASRRNAKQKPRASPHPASSQGGAGRRRESKSGGAAGSGGGAVSCSITRSVTTPASSASAGPRAACPWYSRAALLSGAPRFLEHWLVS